MHTTLNAAAAYPRGPQQLAVLVRVQAVNATVLVSGGQYLLAVPEVYQNHAGAVVEVRAAFLGAVRVIGHHARDVPGVVLRALALPAALPRLQVDRDDGVAVVICGAGVVLT